MMFIIATLVCALVIRFVVSTTSEIMVSRTPPEDLMDSGLIFQVVIPKTGTTALKFSSGVVWRDLFMKNRTNLLSKLPYLAGDCDHPKKDGMERCVTSKLFPCGKGVRSCRSQHPASHITYSEMRDHFLRERGISIDSFTAGRVTYMVVARDPAERVVSEYYQWKRGWCCSWFFSSDMIRQQGNMTLDDFIAHRDCPAHNRQTWMLADLPPLLTDDGKMILPSQFSLYFSKRYGTSNYVAKLNADESLLTSANVFLSKATVLGLTDHLEDTLSMLFSVTAARSELFYKTSHGCWSLKKPVTMRHDRAIKHALLTENQRRAVMQRNDLDVKLYASAVRKHQALMRQYAVCSAEV